MRGYSYEFMKHVRALASKPDAPCGVKLGAKAIEREFSIISIANHVGVSRMTVYDWFTGKYIPTESNLKKLKAFITSKPR